MALPLYQGAELAAKFKQDSHRGLWWSRFFNKFSSDFSKPADGDKGEFIKELCLGVCGDAKMLEMTALRQATLLNTLGGEIAFYQTQGRFVTGMGNDHPTENGFTWHPTLGIPYLPASSIKGLVRGWLEWQWGAETLKKEGDKKKRHQLLQWFGSENKDPREQLADHQAGWFIFFDALPSTPVQLAADVMTPHYDQWYEKGGENQPLKSDTVPADWHSPVPVTFLTVKKATFQFGVAVRSGLNREQNTEAQSSLPQAMEVLKDALEWAGAGAKTATGYGRMMPDNKANQEINRLRDQAIAVQLEKERKSKLEELSPNLRLIEELRAEIEKRLPKGKLPISDAFWGGRIKKLALEAGQSNEWTAEEKLALADMLQNWAVQIMKLDAKDVRKQLKLAELRGQI